MKSNWQFKMQGDRKAEVFLYEEIGKFWGLAAKDFAEELAALGELDELSVRVNSMGGSVFEGFSIYSLLRENQAKIIMNIDGIAASIASVIAMAGDEIRIAENGFLMIHKPMVITIGDDEEHVAQAERLRKFEQRSVSVYAERSGLPDEEVAAMLKPETWMNAEEAKEKGFADSIMQPNKAAALVIDRGLFPNAPEALAHREIGSRQARQAKDEKDAAAVAIRLRLLELDEADSLDLPSASQ